MKDRDIIRGDDGGWKATWRDRLGGSPEFSDGVQYGILRIFDALGAVLVEKRTDSPLDWAWDGGADADGHWIFTPAETNAAELGPCPAEAYYYDDNANIVRFMGSATITFIDSLTGSIA